MIYVASPYSSPIKELEIQRFRAVRKFTEVLVQQGFVAFSPILYCHPMHRRIGKAGDAMTWHNFNMNMLRRAEAMWALCLPGWETAKGLTMELKVCKLLDIPVIRYDSTFTLMDNEWLGHVPASFPCE